MKVHTVEVVDGAVRPDGPRRVMDRYQVTLPRDQMAALDIGVGDEVWVALNPDKPGTLVVIPVAVYDRIIQKGWAAV